jgi:hypothetical protein
MEYELGQAREDEDDAGDDGDTGGSSIPAHYQSGLRDRLFPKASGGQGRTGARQECAELTKTDWQTNKPSSGAAIAPPARPRDPNATAVREQRGEVSFLMGEIDLALAEARGVARAAGAR